MACPANSALLGSSPAGLPAGNADGVPKQARRMTNERTFMHSGVATLSFGRRSREIKPIRARSKPLLQALAAAGAGQEVDLAALAPADGHQLAHLLELRLRRGGGADSGLVDHEEEERALVWRIEANHGDSFALPAQHAGAGGGQGGQTLRQHVVG